MWAARTDPPRTSHRDMNNDASGDRSLERCSPAADVWRPPGQATAVRAARSWRTVQVANDEVESVSCLYLSFWQCDAVAWRGSNAEQALVVLVYTGQGNGQAV